MWPDCLQRYRGKFPTVKRRLISIYLASFFTAFSSSFASTMMFPFLPFMVQSLLPWLLENETQVGVVASAMFVGRMLSSYFWGTIADCQGRKPVILVSLILVGLSSAMFGFSVHYAMAIVFRFLVGFTNGVIGNVKAVVSEVSDDSNQAFGLSLVGASWGLGIIIGPAVSGVISDPIGQYNITIENDVVREYLTRFPYSLPCLVNLLICLLSAVFFYFLVPETLGMKKNQSKSMVSQGAAENGSGGSTSSSELDLNETDIDASEHSALVSNDIQYHSNEVLHANMCESNPVIKSVSHTESKDNFSDDLKEKHNGDAITHGNVTADTKYGDLEGSSEVTANKGASCGNLQSSENVEPTSRYEDLEEDSPRSGNDKRACMEGLISWDEFKSGQCVKSSVKNHCLYLKDKSVFLSVMLYCTFSFVLIGWNEVFPVWAKTSPHLGGLGFSMREIGLALTIAGAFYLPFSIFLYPLLERHFGSIKLFYGAFLILIPSIILFPNIHYLIAWRELLWFVLCLLLFLHQTCIGVAIACTVLFINNSVTFDKLGAINGLTMSLTSLGRTFSPLVAGGLFSLSLSSTLSGFSYPLDYRLVYLFFGFILLLCVFFVACLPLSINKQKIIEDVHVVDK